MRLSDNTDSGGFSFPIWLRTGRLIRVDARWGAREVKFNPNHDPDTGRFTFADGAGATKSGQRPKAGIKAPSSDPKNSANYTVYKVKPGDTLTSIAASGTGVTATGLEWLNDKSDDRLQVGEEIKVPNQDFLDRGKAAFDKFNALSHYMSTHGGALPPDPAHPPSLVEQVFGPGSKVEKANGYTFDIDPEARTRLSYGQLTNGPVAPRSRTNRRAAGGDDRLDTDDGGHFIATRFNGPNAAFNHFAQDSNVNRGKYRALEDGWASDLRAGKHVSVSISASYPGRSKQPNNIFVEWSVSGRRYRRSFAN